MLEVVERGGELATAVAQDARELLGLLHRRLDPLARELLGGLLDVVDDVVDGTREHVDVLARSNGVILLARRRLTILWVTRSPSSSQSLISWRRPRSSGQ